MNLAEKYGIQKTVEVGSIDLNQNPYTFEGTFMEVYNLVAEGRLQLLKQGNMVVGGSVTGYDTVEQDNLAGMAFTQAFMFKPLMEYLELAVSLVEANLIPELVSETPFRISILNGLVKLDLMGREAPDVEDEPEDEEVPEEEEVSEVRADAPEDTYIVPATVALSRTAMKNYIRKQVGRCFARGAEPTYKLLDNGDWEVSNITWGRKLTRAEIDAIEY